MNRRVLAVCSLLSLAVLAMLLGYGCSSAKPYALQPTREIDQGPRSVRAFVVSHGWHTGLVVPASDLNTLVPELASRFGAPAFYEIGWGDKGFYQAQDVTTGLALRAMFWSSGSVVNVVSVPRSPEISFPESQTLTVCLTPTQIGHLEQFIVSSLAHDPAGRVVDLGEGIYGDSQFYDGVGRYSALNTCNKWTAKGLKSAGMAISPAFKLTSGSIMSFVRSNASPGPCTAN